MNQIELEAQRHALRSEIAITRAALGVESARLREDFKWVLIGSAAMRLVPARFRWVGIVAGAIGAFGLLRARSTAPE
jgi:hypothetical protein